MNTGRVTTTDWTLLGHTSTTSGNNTSTWELSRIVTGSEGGSWTWNSTSAADIVCSVVAYSRCSGVDALVGQENVAGLDASGTDDPDNRGQRIAAVDF